MSDRRKATCVQCLREKRIEARGLCCACYYQAQRQTYRRMIIEASPRIPEPPDDWWPQYLAIPTVTCQCGLRFSEGVGRLHTQRTGHRLLGVKPEQPEAVAA